MGILEKCCFCCDVRKGSLYCGIYCLVTCLVFLCLLVVRFLGYRILQESGVFPGIAFTIIGIFVAEIICTVLLLIGIHRDWTLLFYPWLIATIMTMVLPTAGFIWLLVTSLWEKGEVDGWDLAISSFHFCNSIILIYCFLCVTSQIQDLIKGKGTTDFYRRRRQRRRMIRAFTEMHLPLHVDLELFSNGRAIHHHPPTLTLTPPPYSDKPPSYREGSMADDRNSDRNNNHRSQADISCGNMGEGISNLTESIEEARDHHLSGTHEVEGHSDVSRIGTLSATISDVGSTPSSLIDGCSNNINPPNGGMARSRYGRNEDIACDTFEQMGQASCHGSTTSTKLSSESYRSHTTEVKHRGIDRPKHEGLKKGKVVSTTDCKKTLNKERSLLQRLQTGLPSSSSSQDEAQLNKDLINRPQGSMDESPAPREVVTGSKVQYNVDGITRKSNLRMSKGKQRRSKDNGAVVLRSYERNDEI